MRASMSTEERLRLALDGAVETGQSAVQIGQFVLEELRACALVLALALASKPGWKDRAAAVIARPAVAHALAEALKAEEEGRGV